MKLFLLIAIVLALVSSTMSCIPTQPLTPAQSPTPTPIPTPTQTITPYNGPIIDVHSQFDQYVEREKIIKLMNQAGVATTILSTRGTVTPEELISFADNYPRRIVPAVRTKGYMEQKDDKYYNLLKKQVNIEQYGAMAEVLIYHAQKGDKAPLVVYDLSDEKVQAALDYTLKKNWPFVPHIEFAAAGIQRDELMSKLEALLIRYPEHPFVLIHMGELNHIEVLQLIEAHENIYFITSHSNPIAAGESGQPWTNMFDGDSLLIEWKQLMTEQSDRFILGFDNVFPEHWGKY
ncbi:hypothetical protein ACFLV4_08265, partial [Chloroflexota bacterium]